MKNLKDKYYLINDRYLLMTDVPSAFLQKCIKEQFDIDVFSIKVLTEQEYINMLLSNNYKTTVKEFVFEVI